MDRAGTPLAVAFQFCIGVKLLVAAVTAVLVVSGEVLALHVAKGSNLRVCNLSTQLAFEFSPFREFTDTLKLSIDFFFIIR